MCHLRQMILSNHYALEYIYLMHWMYIEAQTSSSAPSAYHNSQVSTVYKSVFGTAIQNYLLTWQVLLLLLDVVLSFFEKQFFYLYLSRILHRYSCSLLHYWGHLCTIAPVITLTGSRVVRVLMELKRSHSRIASLILLWSCHTMFRLKEMSSVYFVALRNIYSRRKR